MEFVPLNGDLGSVAIEAIGQQLYFHGDLIFRFRSGAPLNGGHYISPYVLGLHLCADVEGLFQGIVVLNQIRLRLEKGVVVLRRLVINPIPVIVVIGQELFEGRSFVGAFHSLSHADLGLLIVGIGGIRIDEDLRALSLRFG